MTESVLSCRDEIVACAKSFKSNLFAHDGVVCLLLYFHFFRRGIGTENKIASFKGCFSLTLQRRAYHVFCSRDGSHGIAEVPHKSHLFIGFKLGDVGEVNIRGIYSCPCEGDFLRTLHKCPCILPFHVAEGELVGLVRRRRVLYCVRIRRHAAAVYRTVDSDAGDRTVAIGNVLRRFRNRRKGVVRHKKRRCSSG